MSYIRTNDYSQERKRPNLLANYVLNMTRFLQTQFPNEPVATLSQFVKETARARFESPTVEAVYHKREGFSEIIKKPLHVFVTEIIKDNHLSPSGSTYVKATKRESFLRRSIEMKVAERNKFKKMYLDFEAQGKKRESQYYYQNQANAKIFNNAIAGGMKIQQFILGSKAGFNAITSTGRMSVKQGYSYIERAVNGNIYLPSSRDAVTYILNHANHVPEGFSPLIERRELYVPSVTDVSKYLYKSMAMYMSHPDMDFVESVLLGLTDVERSYVFYAGCFDNLCRFNDSKMRSWIDSCFYVGPVPPEDYADIDVNDIKTFKDDVKSCILATNYKRLGRNPTNPEKWNTLKDAVKYNPDGLKEFIYVAKYFVANFEKLLHIIRPIFRIETTFSKLTLQHKMARKTVPLSDTDSNIFSTQELIRWKRGKIDFKQESYEMNALITFIISQSFEHVFARLSAGFGAEGKDVYRIAMKNEFLYPVVIVTALAKHYLAIATMQEGSYLPNPRKDFKGVGLRSSTYPKIIKDEYDAYVVSLVEKVYDGEQIRAASILEHVANVERNIWTSVMAQNSDFLQTQSVKRKEDYSDPDRSQYFSYELWQAVFAPDFGEMVIPNKCYKIPLIGGKKFFKDPKVMAMLEEKYPDVKQRLLRFMEDNPGRDITALLVPPFKGKIDPLFLQMMDIRFHISQIMAGYYHLLNALGIGTPYRPGSGLVMDFYDPSQPTIQ